MPQRLRRDKSRERTPPREAPRAKTPPPAPAPATKEVHSGSEEGEIEED